MDRSARTSKRLSSMSLAMDEWRSIKWLEDYAQTHRIREDSNKHIGIVKKKIVKKR